VRGSIGAPIRHGTSSPDGNVFHRSSAISTGDGRRLSRLRSVEGESEQAMRQEEERFAETLGTVMAVLESALASGRSCSTATGVRPTTPTGFRRPHRRYRPERGVRIDMGDSRRPWSSNASGRATLRVLHGERGLNIRATRPSFLATSTLDACPPACGALPRRHAGAGAARRRCGRHLVLDRTPFYAEFGSQSAIRRRAGRSGPHVSRSTIRKDPGRSVGHHGRQRPGVLRVGVGDARRTSVDQGGSRRARCGTISATHLMHAARCVRCSASTSREARWSRRSARASTSRIPGR